MMSAGLSSSAAVDMLATASLALPALHAFTGCDIKTHYGCYIVWYISGIIQNFGLGLGLEALASASDTWPRSHCLVFAEMNPKVVTLQTLQYDLLTCIQTFVVVLAQWLYILCSTCYQNGVIEWCACAFCNQICLLRFNCVIRQGQVDCEKWW